MSQVLTSNDSFEGEKQKHEPPPGWHNCDDVSSVDTQPGTMSNNKYPSDGYTYISLVTREVGPPGTVETVWADLNTPFLKDQCYRISLDLSLSEEFHGSYNWTTYYFDNPCVLQIIGFNEECENMDSSEILWKSDVLSNYDWETFNVTVNPQLDSYTKIALRANFTEPDNHKNSVVFVDNLRFQDTTDVLFFDPETFSFPDWATNIQWYFEDEIIEGGTSHQLPFLENGEYNALFENENGCLLSVSQEVIVDYYNAYLYPNPTTDQATAKYYSDGEFLTVFELYNDEGQLVLSKEKLVKKGLNETVFNLDFLAPGIYFLKNNSLHYFPKSLKVVIRQ